MRIGSIIVFFLLINSLASYQLFYAGVEGASSFDDVISVLSNSDLGDLISDNGWNGSGSEADPYIIENQTIDAEGGGPCILLLNITKHVIIRNCTLFNATDQSTTDGVSSVGIKLVNCTNIVIRDSLFYHNTHGMMVERSSWINILENRLENNTIGIKMDINNNISISNSLLACDDNIWIDISRTGMTQTWSNDTSINNVSVLYRYHYSLRSYDSCRLIIDRLDGPEIGLFRTHFSSISNTTHQNSYGSQIKISDSKNVSIRNASIEPGDSYGEIEVLDSQNCSIRDCYLSYTNRGIHLSNSKNITLTNNVFDRIDDWAIYTIDCQDIEIGDQTLKNEPGYYIQDSQRIVIKDHSEDKMNSSRNSPHIYLRESGNISIVDSIFWSNGDNSLFTSKSDNITVQNCSFHSNKLPISFERGTKDVLFLRNHVHSLMLPNGYIPPSLKFSKYTSGLKFYENNLTSSLELDMNESELRNFTFPENNTIAGGRFHIFENTSPLIVPKDATQFYAFNCSTMIIDGLSLENSYFNNELFGVDHLSISNVSIKDFSGAYINCNEVGNIDIYDNYLNSRSGRLINAYYSGDVRIWNNTADDVGEPFSFLGGGNATVWNNQITRKLDRGIIEYGFTLGRFDKIEVYDNILNMNGTRTLTVSADIVKIEGNIVSNSTIGITVSSNQDGVCVLIENNTIENCKNSMPIYGSRGVIQNNMIIGGSYRSLQIHSSENLSIVNNTIKSGASHGIYLYAPCRNLTVKNNIIERHEKNGIYHHPRSNPIKSSNLTIEDNTITNNQQYGIYLSEVWSSSISNNILRSNTDGIWGQIYGSNITRNKMSNLTDYGIYASGLSNTYRDNIISGGEQGIRSVGSDDLFEMNSINGAEIVIYIYRASGNRFTLNTIKDCGEGLNIRYSYGPNEFDNNLFKDNIGLALNISSSDSDIFHHNAFIRNNGTSDSLDPASRQVVNLNETVKWNDEKGDGNYWHDLAGPDSDMDGIVDIPYEIPGTSANDTRPLSYNPLITAPSEFNITSLISTVDLKWNRSYFRIGEDQINGYEVFRKTGPIPWELITVNEEDDLDFRDDEFNEEGTVKYIVRASSNIGPGTHSDILVGSPDLYAPLLKMTFPLEGGIYSDNSMEFTWEASDNVSGVDSFQIRLDSSEWTDIGNLTSWAINGLSEGEHLFEVKAFDRLGLTATTSVGFLVDTICPEISVRSPQNGSYHNSSIINLQWEAFDSTSGIENILVTLDNGQSWDCTDLEMLELRIPMDGRHNVSIEIRDHAGNENLTHLTIHIDTQNPLFKKISGFDDSYLSEEMHLFEWSATDSGSGIETVEISINDGGWMVVDAVGSYELDLRETGFWSCQFRVVDRAGNQILIKKVLNRDNEPPVLDWISINETHYTNRSILLVDFTCHDNISGILGSEIYLDNTLIRSIDWNITSFMITFSETGIHDLSVKIFDLAGNTNTYRFKLNYDNTLPSIEKLSPDGGYLIPGQNITVTFDEYVVFHVELETGEGEIMECSFQQVDNSFILKFNENVNWGTELHFTITAEDLAGNVMGPYNLVQNIFPLREVILQIVDEKGNAVKDLKIEVIGSEHFMMDADDPYSFIIEPGTFNVIITGKGIEEKEFTIVVEPALEILTYDVTVELTEGDTKGSSIWILFALIVLVLVLLSIALFIFIRKSKQRMGLEETDNSLDDTNKIEGEMPTLDEGKPEADIEPPLENDIQTDMDLYPADTEEIIPESGSEVVGADPTNVFPPPELLIEPVLGGSETASSEPPIDEETIPFKTSDYSNIPASNDEKKDNIAPTKADQ